MFIRKHYDERLHPELTAVSENQTFTEPVSKANQMICTF